MLKKEFEELTGMQLTDNEFNSIDKAYMDIPYNQRKELYKEFSNIKDSNLFNAMTFIIRALIAESRVNNSRIESLAHFMIDESICDLNANLRNKAAELIGMKAVIAYKAEKRYEFDDDELSFIATQLSL